MAQSSVSAHYLYLKQSPQPSVTHIRIKNKKAVDDYVPVMLGKFFSSPLYSASVGRRPATNIDWRSIVSGAISHEDLKTELVLKHLRDPRWDFRTIRGLSKSTGLSPQVVRSVIENNSSLIRKSLVPNKHREELYTLRSRRPTLREYISAIREYL